MKNKTRKSIRLNRIEVPLTTMRDTILERDPSYKENLTCLCLRINSGKIPHNMYGRIQPSLAMAAMRRAGVSFRESVNLLRA